MSAHADLAAAFDPREPLPRGHRSIEASAGTGKTHALVGLALRFLAEGRCTADELLLVTFSRSATRELRSRLLERLDAVVSLLAGTGGTRDPSDEVEELLLDGDPADVRARSDRLRAAVADLDHATVTTIHAFADDLLRRIGDPALGSLLEDDGAMVGEILADVYVRLGLAHPALAPDLPYPDGAGMQVIRAGMHHPREALRPDPHVRDMTGARVYLAIAAGDEARRRRAAARVHTYDDLLTRLAGRLADEDGATPLARLLRRRFRVGLVDEFQDTDPLQWQVLRALFDDPDGTDGRTLVLVGDPKQAIYAFRGADINAYLAGRGDRADRTLPINRRADAPMVQACQELFRDVPLGHGIGVTPVQAAHPPRLRPLPGAAVRFRVVADDAPVPAGKSGPRVGALREHVAADVAEHAVTLLQGGHQVQAEHRGRSAVHAGKIVPAPGGGSPPDDDGHGWRAVAPADLTILVRTNAQAATVRRHLEQRGVPVVLNGVGNVLHTPAARDWLALLRALQQPWDGARVRLAALTDLIGWTPQQLVLADERQRDRLHITLHEMAEVLAADGVAAAQRRLDAVAATTARLQGRPEGTRRLADLLHVTELLHVEQRRGGLGLSGLIGWLEQAIAGATDPPPEGLARRLERQADAVEIMTVHGAKGLERGIVLVPFLWDTTAGPGDVCTFTDPVTQTRRVDVGGRWPPRPDYDANRDLAAQEDEQEELRLAYVALTRARHHLVLWWACTPRTRSSPLSMLLARGRQTSTAAAALEHIGRLGADHPHLFTHDILSTAVPLTTLPPQPTTPELALATIDRSIDQGWRRWSYSRLASGAEGVDPGPAGTAPILDPATAPEGLARPVPLGAMPGGAEVGSLVHAVLEHVDFTADDRAEQLLAGLRSRSRSSSVQLGEDDPAAGAVPGTLAQVVVGIGAVLDTPLGPIGGGVALSDIPRSARIDELEFELPVLHGAAAEQPGRLLLDDVAALLAEHLPADDPLHAYPQHLAAALGTLEVRGFLAGFIDLLVRVPSRDGGPDRYLVADYKTNRIAPGHVTELLAGHFSRQAMAAEMIRHHYPLQALFYVVAAHRYLRWRVPDYDPATHLAGVAYLFIRGMTGPGGPRQPDGTPLGVLAWTPPAALVSDLDRLLAEGRRA